jgi:hypothetical protein
VRDEAARSREARASAEAALVRVVHHYGSKPEFVLLGGLVPQLLCSTSDYEHAGTTDVDVQVNLEVATGSVNSRRLERALRDAEFEPEGTRAWRWTAAGRTARSVVKFELLADLDDVGAQETILFDDCEALGAVNLRGTGFASRDVEVRTLRARIGGQPYTADVNVTGLAGFLLAKAAAARERRLPKDWYDMAFVLLNNDAGGPAAAAAVVRERFGKELGGRVRTAMDDLLANFANPTDQGPRAFVEQMVADHPDADREQLATDAILAVGEFHEALFGEEDGKSRE